MKPHREEKRSTEANDEAHPRNKRQAQAPDPGAQRKEQKPKAKVILRSRSRGKENTHDPKGDPILKEY